MSRMAEPALLAVILSERSESKDLRLLFKE
jgi:hypothetical protein